MRAVRGIALVLGVLLLLVPRPSEAGRRAFIWAFDTAVVPEGDVELEQWLWARTRASRSGKWTCAAAPPP